MMHQKWTILVIFLAIICGDQSFGAAHNGPCTKSLKQFIESQKQFTQCAMNNGVPVKMCQMCVQPYVSTVQGFHDLTIEQDPNSPRHKCIDQFINHNTLNIVWNQYQSSRNLWNEAACTSCFVPACDPDKLAEGSNITEICEFNKNVIDIRNQTENLMKCFNASDNKAGNVCTDCVAVFNLIDNQYKQLGGSSNGICFDVVDQFNQTRNTWYDEKHCPRPIVPSTLKWVVITVLMCLVTLGGSIAGGYFLFTKYRQRGNYAEHTDSDNVSVTGSIQS